MAEPEKKVIRRSNKGLWIGGTLLITFFIGLFYAIVLDKKKVNINIPNKVNRNIVNLVRKHN